MDRAIKLFFDSNVILGSAQLKLLEEPQLSVYITQGILGFPQPFLNSKRLIEKISELREKGVDVDPFISKRVKGEMRTLINKMDVLSQKILKPLKVQQKITKMPDPDKKIFEVVVYEFFMIKLPLYVDEIVDSFNYTSVDDEECFSIRDELFSKVYAPLIPKFLQLVDKFELSGMPEATLQKEKDYFEYNALLLNLRSFRDESSPHKFKDFRRITDLMILAEAVFSYRKMLRELKVIPDFYFVSNDTICLPIYANQKVFDKVPQGIKSSYGIGVMDAMHMLEFLSKLS